MRFSGYPYSHFPYSLTFSFFFPYLSPYPFYQSTLMYSQSHPYYSSCFLFFASLRSLLLILLLTPFAGSAGLKRDSMYQINVFIFVPAFAVCSFLYSIFSAHFVSYRRRLLHIMLFTPFSILLYSKIMPFDCPCLLLIPHQWTGSFFPPYFFLSYNIFLVYDMKCPLP